MQQLAGKVALVTGASKGAGRRFVKALIANGVKVGALARPSAELASLAAEFGTEVLVLPCDITNPEAVNASVAKAAAHFGRIDILVNNAAIFHPFSFEQATDQDIRSHIDTNLLGICWLIRAAIPHLRATKGQIVSITSESVRMPFPMLALYAATKSAVETLSAGLRDELRSESIRVSVLRSGSIDSRAGETPPQAPPWPPEVAQAFFAKILKTGHAAMSGAPASPESMAQALISILSLPEDISADLIEVRASREGLPAGAQKLAEESR